MHKLNELLQQSGLSDMNPDDVLLHYGVKGMKWDKEKNKVEEVLKKSKVKTKQMASDIVRTLKDAKKNPKQTLKNVTGVTKKERAQINKMNIVRKLDPEAARLSDAINKKIKDSKNNSNKKTIVITKDGKYGSYNVSHPFNKDGSSKNSNKKTTVITKDGKYGSWNVSHPFNKDGSSKNSKVKVETSVTKIKSPSEKSIKSAAKYQAEQYKKKNYTTAQKLMDKLKNRKK